MSFLKILSIEPVTVDEEFTIEIGDESISLTALIARLAYLSQENRALRLEVASLHFKQGVSTHAEDGSTGALK